MAWGENKISVNFASLACVVKWTKEEAADPEVVGFEIKFW